MERKGVLFVLWLVFAAAAVGVGFGAAGLVGDPFSNNVATGPVSVVSGDRSSSSPSASPPPSSSADPSRASSTGSPSASSSSVRRSRSLSTVGGFVSARCSEDLVDLSASPAVGWRLDEISSGSQASGFVEFRESGDGDGRVEVTASCAASEPEFVFDDRRGDDRGGNRGDDDGGHGGRDNSGPGGGDGRSGHSGRG